MVGVIVQTARSSAPSLDREQTLTRLLRRGERLHRQGTRASNNFSRWRLVLFLIALLITISLYRLGYYPEGNWSTALFLITFVIVAGYHNRLEHRIHRLTIWSELKRQHLARLRLD